MGKLDEADDKADKSANRLQIADDKLKFADYLIHRDNFSDYATAITKHLLDAANKAVSVNFGLDGTSVSHILINKKLSEGEKEEREFSGSYLTLWTLPVQPSPARADIEKAMARVKTFVSYVKGRQIL